jgi:PH (Pleckstrin Homology) domain-containing protein
VSDKQVFRSPTAVVVWWVWALFALGNLIDLAVQGRDHLALVAAFILLFVTGIVYVTALRPRVIADADALTIVNPVTEYRIGWAAVAGADGTDLLRVRCAWPDGDGPRRRVVYAWAVHSPRRKQVAAEMRGQRLARRTISGAGGFGARTLGTAGDQAPEPDPLRVDADKVAATLTERAERARLEAPDVPATAPVSAWPWPAVAAVVVPGLALLVVALT